MDNRNRRIVAVIALFFVVCIAGQAIVYGGDAYRFDAVAEFGENNVMVDIDTNYALEYSILSLRSDSTFGVSSYAIWCDEAYPVIGDLDAIRDCIHRLQLYFTNSNSSLDIITTDELTRIVASGDTSTAVLFITGTLPSSIYTGNQSDPIFDWLAVGGVMYWLSEKIGHSYAEKGLPHTTQVYGSDILFFGATDVVRAESNEVYTRNIESGSVTSKLGIYYGEVTNGIDCSRLTTPYLALDCNDGTYSAATFIQYHGGTGAVCVFGGHIKHEDVPTSVMASVTQAVVSGVSYDTMILDNRTGSGDASFNLHSDDSSYVYVYVGEMNTIWAKCLKRASAM